MCDLCDGRFSNLEEYDEHLRQIVGRSRFAVQAVEGSRCQAEFSCTVGLTPQGLPELVITGMRSETASRLLRMWGDYLLDRSAVLPGETMECGPWLLEAVEVAEPHEHLRTAVRFYGEAVRGLQLAWADQRGRWPWEPGHRARRAGQPLLGEPAPHVCEEHRSGRLDVPGGLG